jgi:hypothetical protein
MATLTEIVTAMVVHSSAAAYSHFGVAVEVKTPERPAPVARTVSRVSPPKSLKPASAVRDDEDCPEAGGRVVKA